ncbi:MAG: MFS transporter [Thermaerobacter sp.]|nr:MFS transporter [Thermaerobacter sp.]
MNVLMRYSGFRWVWIGQLLSQLGNAVFYVLGLWEIQLRDPFLLAVAGLAMTIPALLSLIGGVIVDRYDPRKVMLLTDMVRGTAVLAGLLLLAVPGSLVWVVIVLLGVESLGSALFYPAETVMIPQMVASQDLVAANGIYGVTSQLSSAIGYALGGAAVAAIGIPVIFGWDMSSYWLSALAIWLMMRIVGRPHVSPDADRPGSGGSGLMTSVVEGWHAFRTIPGLMRLLPWIVLMNFAFVAGIIMLPLWVHRHLLSGALWYGIVYGAWAGGMVLGGVFSGQFAKMRLKTAFAAVFGTQVVFLFAFAGSDWPFLSASMMLGTGICNGVGNAVAMAWWQRIIPPAIRGRVFGLIMTLFGLASPVGSLAAGILLHVLPLYWAWLLAALGSLGFVIELLRTPGNLEDMTVHSPPKIAAD